MKLIILLVFLDISVIKIETARILAIFPTPSISHQLVFRALTIELAKCGHEVIFVTPDPSFSSTPNLTEIDVHNVSYTKFLKEFPNVIAANKDDLSKLVEIAVQIIEKVFVKQLENEEFIKIAKSLTFDLILVESYLEICLALSHVYKAPLLRVSSLGAIIDDHTNVGSQRHMLIYPEYLYKRSYNLTWSEKIIKVYEYFSNEYMFYKLRKNTLLPLTFGPNMLSLEKLRNNVEGLFLNIRHIWDNNRPIALNTIYLGGLHETEAEDLSKDLKSYLDSSTDGVIYMSFGNNVFPSELPPEKIQIFINVFSQLPYNVLWKWDKDELADVSSNVKIAKWFPQSKLLRHPKIKLFITQGGLQSMDEALNAGVPMISFPFLCDQWYNSEKYVYYKIGKHLDFNTLTEDELQDAIKNILKDDSYRVNVMKLRTLMNDQPQSPLSRAVWWTEYVLQHGGARHLRAPSTNMSWSEYFEVELLIILFLALITTFYAFIKLINLLLKLFKQFKKCICSA